MLNPTEVREWIQTAATLGAAAGVWFAWRQIQLSQEQAVATFEEGFNTRYRAIARELPVQALLGENVAPEDLKSHLPVFYQYVDLTNEEIRLRRDGTICDLTWHEWEEGIRWALSRPAFRAAWHEILDRTPDSFGELRRFEREDYRGDPKQWKHSDGRKETNGQPCN